MIVKPGRRRIHFNINDQTDGDSLTGSSISLLFLFLSPLLSVSFLRTDPAHTRHMSECTHTHTHGRTKLKDLVNFICTDE